MLNKVALNIILGTALCALTTMASQEAAKITRPSPYKFKSILATAQPGPGPGPAPGPSPASTTTIGLDSGEGRIYIDNDSPIDKYTLRAECNFGRAGKITIIEHFTNEVDGLTFNGKVDTPEPTTAEREAAANAGRYLELKIDGLNTLCPRSSYTLTLH